MKLKIAILQPEVQMEDNFPVSYRKYSSTEDNYTLRNTFSDYTKIIRVLSGWLNVRIDSEDYELIRGDMIYIRAKALHSINPSDCIYECIEFDLSVILKSDSVTYEFISGVINSEYLIEPMALNSIRYKFNTPDFLYEAMSRKPEGYEFDVTGALYILFGCIYRNRLFKENPSLTATKGAAKYRLALRYIENHYNESILLDDIAASVDMSPKYFCRYFKNYASVSPITYLNSYRIKKACADLSGSDLPVADIACNHGFNDTSYFIKIFKKETGLTPGQYRTHNKKA